mmetsp:Transcript_6470/g.13380  ORF Transcript_6470/g.13380 Transcript_6470/m.13380 type:complete len:225 (-) Transcript_6470:61-735(-)
MHLLLHTRRRLSLLCPRQAWLRVYCSGFEGILEGSGGGMRQRSRGPVQAFFQNTTKPTNPKRTAVSRLELQRAQRKLSPPSIAKENLQEDGRRDRSSPRLQGQQNRFGRSRSGIEQNRRGLSQNHEAAAREANFQMGSCRCRLGWLCGRYLGWNGRHGRWRARWGLVFGNASCQGRCLCGWSKHVKGYTTFHQAPNVEEILSFCELWNLMKALDNRMCVYVCMD